MRIGIDCRTILNPRRGERAGVGHYTYYLVKTLLRKDKKNHYVLFFDYRMTDTREFEQKNVTIKHFPFSQYKKFLPFSYSHLLIAALLGREKLDLYHSPANVIPFTYTGPSVITVHDLAIYKNRKWFPARQKFSTSILVPRSLKKAKKIIAVSEATKRDIIRLFKVPSAKITVIYEGAVRETSHFSKKAITKKYRLPQEYLLYMGTLEPRKNLRALLAAYADLVKKEKNNPPHLILAGYKGFKHDEVFKQINRLKLNRFVKYLGYVPHEDKIALLKHSLCFVFPTLYEGFGLPVLEAMGQGVPVISSNNSSIPEITGRAALLVNPSRQEELTQAITRVIHSAKLRQSLSQKSISQARQFSWDECVSKTLALYRETVKLVEQTQAKRKK